MNFDTKDWNETAQIRITISTESILPNASMAVNVESITEIELTRSEMLKANCAEYGEILNEVRTRLVENFPTRTFVDTWCKSRPILGLATIFNTVKLITTSSVLDEMREAINSKFADRFIDINVAFLNELEVILSVLRRAMEEMEYNSKYAIGFNTICKNTNQFSTETTNVPMRITSAKLQYDPVSYAYDYDEY